MLNEIDLTWSESAELGTVGFTVAYLLDRETVPRVGLVTIDFSRNAEERIELRPGDSFQVGGETWQLAEVRNPTEKDWAVVLRRVNERLAEDTE